MANVEKWKAIMEINRIFFGQWNDTRIFGVGNVVIIYVYIQKEM